MTNSIIIPILVYTQDSVKNESLGIELEGTFESVDARFNPDYIIASYPDRDPSRTVFHVLGEIFTASLSHEEFIEVIENNK